MNVQNIWNKFISNSKNFKKVILFISLIFIIINLFTLSRHPLPWADDTFFAGVSNSFIEEGKFYQTAWIKDSNPNYEALHYGPMYFYFTSFTMNILGKSIFSFRIVSFLLGILSLILFYKICIRIGLNEKTASLFSFLYLIDNQFLFGIKYGRMESVCVFLTFFAFWLILKSVHSQKRLFLIFISSLSTSLAILTSPRSVIILIPVFIFLIYLTVKSSRNNLFNTVIVYCTPVIILYIIWIFTGFGGFAEFFHYYIDNAQPHLNNTKLFSSFLGGNFFINIIHYPLLFISVCCTVYLLVKRKFFTPVLIYALGGLILYFVLVFETGPYATLIIANYYLIIANVFDRIETIKHRRVLNFSLVIILVISLSLFSFKGVKLISNWENRNPELSDLFIKNYIPEGSKIIGNPIYFFSGIKNNCEFTNLPGDSNVELLDKFLSEQYDFEYLVMSKNSISGNNKLYNYFFNNYSLSRVGELNLKEPGINNKLFKPLADKSLLFIDSFDYSGVIYRREL
ncbi:ArnT family glycosyltransferase [Bacteroidota bacterium]